MQRSIFNYCTDNLNSIFTNRSDIHVADSILHIFETRENIEQFNKKALYRKVNPNLLAAAAAAVNIETLLNEIKNN